MRLNLACGTDYKEGWQNLDVVRQWPGARPCDLLWDARKDPIPFPDDSASEIYSGYLLLHLAPRYHPFVLQEIRRVLAPDGIAVFGEVDMQKVLLRWLVNPFDKSCSELIWGEQGVVHGVDLTEFDKHCWGFTEEKLRQTLEEAGFQRLEGKRIHHPAVWYELTLAARKS